MQRKSLVIGTALAVIAGAGIFGPASTSVAQPYGRYYGYGPGWMHGYYGRGWNGRRYHGYRGSYGPDSRYGYGPGWMHGYYGRGWNGRHYHGYRRLYGPGWRYGYGMMGGYGPGWMHRY